METRDEVNGQKVLTSLTLRWGVKINAVMPFALQAKDIVFGIAEASAVQATASGTLKDLQSIFHTKLHCITIQIRSDWQWLVLGLNVRRCQRRSPDFFIT